MTTASSDTALLDQGSDEWLLARLGKITASRIADVIAMTKAGPSEKRTRYMWELAVERLTGDFKRTFTNDAMLWGIEHEPIAREFYESLNDVSVEQVGFIHHPRFGFAGASPDGLVGVKGGLEIKCLTTINHLKAIHDDKPPSEYIPQVNWQIACCDLEWVDLTLFDPRVPLEMQLKSWRIERDDKVIADLEEKVEIFNGDVEKTIATLWERAK